MLTFILSKKRAIIIRLTQYSASLSLLPIAIVGLMLFSNVLYAEKSYIKCWKNSQGFTECGNQIPREFYNQRIRYIDKQGVTRKVKERAKTQEELNSERELKELLALEEAKKRRSTEYDEILLKTYLTIDDLLASLNSKLQIIKSRSNILATSIALRKQKFSELVSQAAQIERSGKQISQKLTENLDTARNDLRNLQLQINTEEKNTQIIKDTFAHDVERFMISKSKRIQYSLSRSGQDNKLHAVLLSCLTPTQCDQYWGKTIAFIKENASTELLYETDRVAVTDIPKKHRDIAMGVSLLKKPSDNEQKMLFQIRCNLERAGQEFCESTEINNLLKEFKRHIVQ